MEHAESSDLRFKSSNFHLFLFVWIQIRIRNTDPQSCWIRIRILNTDSYIVFVCLGGALYNPHSEDAGRSGWKYPQWGHSNQKGTGNILFY